MRSKQGVMFTELLAVLLLLLLVAAVAGQRLLGSLTESHTEACIETLSRIDGAKLQWMYDNDKEPDALPTWEDLIGDGSGYLRDIPACPAGGNYTINALDTYPSCTESTRAAHPHTFPQP